MKINAPQVARILGGEGALHRRIRTVEDLRRAVLIVPAVPCRPVGRLMLINPLHANAGRIVVSSSFDVPWDGRLL